MTRPSCAAGSAPRDRRAEPARASRPARHSARTAGPSKRSFAWLLGYRRLTIRYGRYATHFCAFLTLAAALTCYKELS